MKFSVFYAAAVSLVAVLVVLVDCHSHGRPAIYQEAKRNINAPGECPDGFFKTESSPQCFRLYDDTRRTCDEANNKCKEEGLTLAHPQDPVSVRAYLVENLGVPTHTWVGARGNGTHQVWQNGEVLSNTSPYWWRWWDRMSSFKAVSIHDCLGLWSSRYVLDRSPGLAYNAHYYKSSFMTLCELPSECPDETFRTGRSYQCFKLFQDVERNWTEAKDNCEANNMILAEPQDPMAVNAYLVEHFGTKHWTWIGARAGGKSFIWQHSGEELSNTSPYWMWQPTTSQLATGSWDYCLGLLSLDYWQPYHSDTPYTVNFCSTRFWSLCEHVLKRLE